MQNFEIQFDLDENGLFGRECPQCLEYFKLKMGTGLPVTDHICPYCLYKGTQQEFFTPDQNEYIKSIITRKVFGQIQKEFSKSFKKLENSTRNNKFIKIKIKSSNTTIPISYYKEKELETHIICDNCGLEFAIFGVFASCPDCSRLNALTIFKKSLEASKRRLDLIDSLQELDLNEIILKDTLTASVSVFDGFGKALIKTYSTLLPPKPKNLFQNIKLLSETLLKTTGKGIDNIIDPTIFAFLVKMFQVRHLYEHNMGVIDQDFINKTALNLQLGRKYKLERDEIENFIVHLENLGEEIENLLVQTNSNTI
jgi:hypothetical protein